MKWISCVPSAEATAGPVACSEAVFPSHLQVRIISRSRNLASSTFGVSYLAADGTGCYSNVFFSPAAILHSAYGQDIGSILGHVMAHEIAHLLLGINSHSQFGIMRARWQREELLRASKGELFFTEHESQIMRQQFLPSKNHPPTERLHIAN